MIKKMLGWGGTLSILTLAACGGNVQEIGDAMAGNRGSKPHTSNGSSSAGNTSKSDSSSSESGSNDNGGAAAPFGTCDPPCGEGLGCAPLSNDPAGLCAPYCDYPQQGQAAENPVSCTNSVRGGSGQCVFGLGFYWPYPDGEPALPPGQLLTGLCSNACDPLAQDCPNGFTCDLTATFSVTSRGLYACMPNTKPRVPGDTCYSTRYGECGPGLTCSLLDKETSSGTCETLCDMRDPSTCPTGRTCTESFVTQQDNDPNIGVCL